MWGFLRRQLKNKTGKAAMGLIVGVIVNAVAGPQIGDALSPVVTDTVVQAVNGVFDPLGIPLGLLGMYLRDKEAKKEARPRRSPSKR